MTQLYNFVRKRELMRSFKSNDLINYWLNKNNEELSKHFNANVLVLRSPLKWGIDSIVRNYVEDIQEAKKGKPGLVVLLETTGGYIEIVERIYSVFRKYYPNDVRFIIPNYAYSAGTVLVLSGDEIYMDYYSILGPIDPQYESDGQFLPGIGYLHKFNELVEKINENGEKAKAELAYLIKRFDPAKLFHIEQARDHSVTLLKEWLPKHKFKNWEHTETRKIQVTTEYKAENDTRKTWEQLYSRYLEDNFYRTLENLDTDLSLTEIEDKSLWLPYASPPKLSNEKWK